MDQLHKPRIHAQTLSEMNHCVGTARRDAAYACLCELAVRDWPADVKTKQKIYSNCFMLAKEVLESMKRSTLMYSDPRQEIYDRPLFHYLHLIDEWLQTISMLYEHVQSIRNEADVLSEHLGAEAYGSLERSCEELEKHGVLARETLVNTLDVGRSLVKSNSDKSKQSFSEDEMRRYDKAYAEYMKHYRSLIENSGIDNK